jgi:hypothetical protein
LTCIMTDFSLCGVHLGGSTNPFRDVLSSIRET